MGTSLTPAMTRWGQVQPTSGRMPAPLKVPQPQILPAALTRPGVEVLAGRRHTGVPQARLDQ